MHLTGLELAIALAVVFAGGFVQGSVGFGLNLVAVPAIALLEPAAVPGAMFLLGTPMSLLMAWHERDHIDWPGVRAMTAGRLPGTLVGLWLLHVLTGDRRLLFVGLSVIAATVVTALAPEIPRRGRTQIPAGLATGITGTVAGIDGPPLALLYQHAPAWVVRPTLATMFAMGGIVSASVAATSGDVRGWHLLLSAVLFPGILAGNIVARRFRHRIPTAWFRIVVLIVVGTAGVVTTLRGAL